MKLFGAAWVLPVSAPPLRDGRVAVDDAGVIQWVGRPGDPGEPEGALQDLGDAVLLPGLVNAHCHLELSHLEGLAQRTGPAYVPWIEAVVKERPALSEVEIKGRVAAAVQWVDEQTATVAIGDISNTLVSVTPLALSSMRAVVFHEVLGWDPARAAEALAEADNRWMRLDTGTASVRVVMAAHAPHSVSPALFTALKARGGTAALHLAESPDESRFLRDGSGDWPAFLQRRGLGHVRFDPPRKTPVEYAESLGILGPGLVAAHGVQVSDVDIAILAQRGVSVAVCPSSNRNLGVGTAPAERMVRGGVRVCLGTDSLASGDSLDVAREMAEMHRLFPELAPRAILRMATLAGASALGMSDLGAIAPGRRAALAVARGPVPDGDPERSDVSGQAALAKVRM